MRWLRSVACAVLAVLAPSARGEAIDVQVNRAIERGIAVARTYVGADGAGRTSYHGAYPEGDTALLLYTLVKSGVSADDPQVRKCLEWLRARPMTKTYGAGVFILALDAFKDRAFDPPIQEAARWIEEHFHQESRRWNYPGNHTDLSNTQYAVLGLWTAERHGYAARPDTWAALLAGVTDLSMPEEGFAYRRDHRTTGSMTVAGITVLELALARSPDGELPARFADVRHKAKAALAKAWGYLDRRFSAEGNPLGAHSFKEDWLHYYLYGVERLCAITEREKIGGHDWYDEGARHLVATQRADGSWGDPWNTCFALLFLRRATFTTMDRAARRLEGEGVAAAAPPVPPRADVPFVRRWLVLGPLDDPDDDLLEKSFFSETRASPRALAYSGANRWDAMRSLSDEVDLGGPGGPRENAITCAFVWVHAADDVDAVLWFGHDNGCRLWFDGKLLHDRHFEERYGPDTFSVRVHLEAGAHRLLMKVENAGGPHSLWLRIARPDGSPASGIRTSLAPDDAEFEAEALANPAGQSLDDLLCLLPRERRPRLAFDEAADVDRIAFDGVYGPYPLWEGEPDKRGSHRPNPGATGVIAIHPVSPDRPMTAYWKVKVPDRSPRLRIRASATTVSSPGRADALLTIAVFDGGLRYLASEPVGPDAAPDAAKWRWIETDLAGYEGREVLLLLAATNGGRTNWHWEGVWIDEMEIR